MMRIFTDQGLGGARCDQPFLSIGSAQTATRGAAKLAVTTSTTRRPIWPCAPAIAILIGGFDVLASSDTP
jgi:hypothetical protein